MFWDKGSNTDADYFTKHWATSVQRIEREKYIHYKLTLLSQAMTKHMDCKGVLK